MVQDAHLHRLWYDLRSQSMFEASFRDDVAAIDASLERMIWRIVSQYADHLGAAPAVSPATAYAMFDGLFQHGLIQHLFGHPDAADRLRDTVELMLPTMVHSTARRLILTGSPRRPIAAPRCLVPLSARLRKHWKTMLDRTSK